MSTTNLFVELVVIGVGAAAWLTLLLLAVFGYEWVPVDKLFSPSAAVPILAIVYLLGIVTDRGADAFLGPLWAKRNRARVYTQDGDSYAEDRMLVLSEPEFGKLLEYNKSRQRICRGWILNAIALLFSLHALLWLQHGFSILTFRVAMFGSVLLLLLAWGCWFSGRRLNAVLYRKVKEQAASMRAEPSAVVSNEPLQRTPQKRRR